MQTIYFTVTLAFFAHLSSSYAMEDKEMFPTPSTSPNSLSTYTTQTPPVELLSPEKFRSQVFKTLVPNWAELKNTHTESQLKILDNLNKYPLEHVFEKYEGVYTAHVSTPSLSTTFSPPTTEENSAKKLKKAQSILDLYYPKHPNQKLNGPLTGLVCSSFFSPKDDIRETIATSKIPTQGNGFIAPTDRPSKTGKSSKKRKNT